MPEPAVIEQHPPDIDRWRDGGSGVDWVHVLDSGRAGPTVMVQALTHGNEICGAIALHALLAEGVPLRQGRLETLPPVQPASDAAAALSR